MRNVNWRLWCSGIAIAIPLLLLVLPSTRPHIERSLWRMTGEFDEKLLLRFPSSSDYGDVPLIEHLHNYGGSKGLESAKRLASIGEAKRDPAYFAFALQKLLWMSPPYSNADTPKFSLLEQNVFLAESGLALAPKNSYFALAKANALTKLGRTQEMSTFIGKLRDPIEFETYSLKAFELRLEALRAKVEVPIASDAASHWDQGVLHMGLSGTLLVGLEFVSSLPDGLRQDFAIRLIQFVKSQDVESESDLGILCGDILIGECLIRAAKLDGSYPQPEFSVAARLLASRALAAGRPDEAKFWQSLKDFRPRSSKEIREEFRLEPYSPVHYGPIALVILISTALMGAAFFIERNLDASPSHSLAIAAAIGVTTLFVVSTKGNLGSAMAAGLISSSCYFGFRIMFLPGQRIGGWTALGLALLALLITVLAGADWELAWRLLALWIIPFVAKRTLSPISVKSAAVLGGVVMVTLACLLAIKVASVFEYSPSDPWKAYAYFTSIGIVAVPLFLATFSSVVKLTIADSAKVLDRVLPAIAVAASLLLFLGVRIDLRSDQVWRAYFLQSAPDIHGFRTPKNLIDKSPSLRRILGV